MVITKYLTVLSGKYPANLYRIPDSAGCLNFTGYRISVSGSGTSLAPPLITSEIYMPPLITSEISHEITSEISHEK